MHCLITMQMTVKAEDQDAADEMGQAAMRWAGGFYGAEGRVLSVVRTVPSDLMEPLTQ